MSLGAPTCPRYTPSTLPPTPCYAKLELPIFSFLLYSPSLSTSLSPSLPSSLSLSPSFAPSLSFTPEVTERNKRRCQLTAPLQSDKFWWKCLAAAKIRFSRREGGREGGGREEGGREQEAGARQCSVAIHRYGGMISRGSVPWTSPAFWGDEGYR